MLDSGCKDYDSDSMIVSELLSINNNNHVSVFTDNGTADFLEPEDSLVCKVNDLGEKFPEDAMIDKPQSLPSMSIVTPSPDPQYL